MRRQATFRFPALFLLLLFLFGGYVQEARAQEPAMIRLVIREGNTVWGMCRTVSSLRQLPGSLNDCVNDTGARNGIENMRAIPAGSTLSFAVVGLPGETSASAAAASADTTRSGTELQQQITRLEAANERLRQALARASGVVDTRPFWLAIGVLAIIALAALVAWAMSARGRYTATRRYTEELRDVEAKYRDKCRDYDNVVRENEELIQAMAEKTEQRDFPSVPVILKREYVDGDTPVEKRTFYVEITGKSVRDGEMVLFCKLPWGQYCRYTRRRVEREFYTHEDELEDLNDISIHFEDNLRNLSFLFEQGPPEVYEILDEPRRPPHSEDQRDAIH